ncbi:PTS sugar transporter subunit IIC [Mycoplasma hafezii]|uniref:PTS sugar transporter subunit IIC n=1 Tax=Mycoplasma hafezii TaxID=525886 RepID=UPI003CEE1D53
MTKAKPNVKSKLKNMFSTFERVLMPFMGKLGENRYINAIRNGMVAIIPILLIGSTFLIIFFFPTGKSSTFGVDYLLKVSPKWAYFLMLPYRITYPMLGFFAVIGITRSLAKSYKLDDQQAIFMSIVVYLISIVGPTYKSIGNPSFTTGQLGAATVFGGILISIFTVEIFRLCLKYKITIRLPKSVPPVIAKPFNALIPMLLVILPSVFLFNFLEFDIHKYVSYLLSPIQSVVAGNNYFGFIVVVVFFMVLWIAGIHGAAIVGALARPFWLIALAQNTALLNQLEINQIFVKDGANILVEPFFQWFVWIGGAGATLGLIIVMLLIAKSKYIRAITYPSILPGIFNINEPIIFGYPLVLNPYLALPSILAPIAMGTVTFILMKLNLVPVPVQLVGWTLPSPVGAVLSTGLSWQAGLLAFANIAISALIWWPFAKAYDKKLVREEIEQEYLERSESFKKQGIEFNHEELRQEIAKEINSRSIFKLKKHKK